MSLTVQWLVLAISMDPKCIYGLGNLYVASPQCSGLRVVSISTWQVLDLKQVSQNQAEAVHVLPYSQM